MNAAATTAGWLSFLVTAVGLGSLITQASTVQDRLDPYHTSRTEDHLGAWRKRQPKKAWNRLAQPTPVGPIIYARLVDGSCGFNAIGVSRLPAEKPGKASWTAILAIFHEQAPSQVYESDTRAYRADNETELANEHLAKTPTAFTVDVEPMLASVRNSNHGHLCRLVLLHATIRQRAS